MVRSSVFGVQCASLPEVPLGHRMLAQVEVGLADRQPQPGLGQRLVREPARQHRGRRVQRLTQGDLSSEPARLTDRPGGDQYLVLDEPEHGGRLSLRDQGPPLGLFRLGPLPLGPHHPDRGPDHARGQHSRSAPLASCSTRRRRRCSTDCTSARAAVNSAAFARSSAARRRPPPRRPPPPRPPAGPSGSAARHRLHSATSPGPPRTRPAGRRRRQSGTGPRFSRTSSASVPSNGRLAGQDHAQQRRPGRTRPTAASTLSDLAGRLLGGHVRRRAQHAAGLGQVAVGVAQRADLGRVGGSPGSEIGLLTRLAGLPPGPWPAPSP